jgi:hypothetical protein
MIKKTKYLIRAKPDVISCLGLLSKFLRLDNFCTRMVELIPLFNLQNGMRYL